MQKSENHFGQVAADRHTGEQLAESLRQRVFQERLSLYYGSLLPAIAATLVNSGILMLLLLSPEKQTALLLWFSCLVLWSVYRFASMLGFRRQSPALRLRFARRWYLDMLAGATVAGAAWGAAGFLFYDGGNTFDLFVLAILLAGMAAGAMVSLSAFRGASTVFFALILLPFAARLAGDGTAQTRIMAAIVVFYFAMLVFFGRRVHQTVVNGLEMSQLRSRAEQTIEQQALFDELTGLPNRRLLQDRLSQALAYVNRSGGQAALLFLDLDHFKRVNDSLGHAVGDRVLEEVALRLRAQLRQEDTAARLGGDEFIVLLARVHGDHENVLSAVQRRGEELRQAIEKPMTIHGNEVHVSASIGVSILPTHTGDLEDLLKHADTAMYHAKDDGRNTIRFFASDMQESIERRMSMEWRLRSAIDNHELELYLQPQHRKDSSVCGAEMLLRWRHDGKLIPPDEFIPVAEDCGLIYSLGDWVVEEACRIAGTLAPLVASRDFSLALNVSPRQFQHKDFIATVIDSLTRHEIPRGLVELEITEGLLIDDSGSIPEKMQILRGHGLRFSIDDFGTGYSSLRYLKKLPLDALKIDSSFVRDVLDDDAHASIVRTIISIARAFELDVIAEGVESAAVHEFLADAGCPRFQGYHYSRPMPLAEFCRLLTVAPTEEDDAGVIAHIG